MNDSRWTPWIGLRRGLTHVLIRCPIAIILWASILWLAAPLLNFFVVSMAIFAMIAVLMIVPGVGIGYTLSRGVTEAAGFVAFPLTLIVIAFVGICTLVGAWLATQIRPVGDWQLGFAVLATGLSGSLWAMKTTLMDEH